MINSMQIHSSEKASKTGIYNQVFTNSLALAWNSILLYFFIVYYRMDFFKLTFVASSTTFRTLANYRILVSLNNRLLFKNSLISKTSHRCSCTKMSSIYYQCRTSEWDILLFCSSKMCFCNGVCQDRFFIQCKRLLFLFF